MDEWNVLSKIRSLLQKEFKAVAILEGTNKDAQFGYAVASGDLDGDGFSGN